MINSLKFAALTSLAAVVSLAPVARADEWNKQTILTVKEEIQLPTVKLEPGTYKLKLMDSASDRHVVQVFDNNDHIITTILAIPNYRIRPTGHTTFTFWEVPAGQAPALRAWFYPGDNFGQEFVYPKNMSSQIASAAKVAVPTTAAATTEEYKTAEVSATDETGNTAALDTSTYTAPAATPAPEPAPTPAPAEVAVAPEPAPAPAPEPTPAPVPAQLPQTGSSVPLIGLAGLLSLAAYFVVRPARVR